MGDWMDTLYTVMTTRAPTVLKRTQDMRKKVTQMTKQIPGESKKENEWIWERRGGGRVKPLLISNWNQK